MITLLADLMGGVEPYAASKTYGARLTGGVTREAAQRMLDAQSSREQRRAIADDVIVNDGGEAALDAQVTALHARYLELAVIPSS